MFDPSIGFDLCCISRMEPLLAKQHFLDRIFTPQEQVYIRSKGQNAAQSMAGIYAAKEALYKALKTGIRYSMTETEVLHDAAGAPYYAFYGATACLTEGRSVSLSISHDGDMAGAVCIISTVFLHKQGANE